MTYRTIRFRVLGMVKAHVEFAQARKVFHANIRMAYRAYGICIVCELLRVTADARSMAAGTRKRDPCGVRVAAMAEHAWHASVRRVRMQEVREIGLRCRFKHWIDRIGSSRIAMKAPRPAKSEKDASGDQDREHMPTPAWP
jgi:hypothetical protein